MKASEIALEHIRESIYTADALRMKSAAVLVSDLKVLLSLAEMVEMNEQMSTTVDRSASEPVPNR